MKLFGNGCGYSYEFMKNNPIVFWSPSGEVGKWIETTDNTYISMLLDYGIIGLALFLLILFIVFKSFLISQTKYKEMGTLILMLLFIEFFFMEGLYWPIIMFMFAFGLALFNNEYFELERDGYEKINKN